MLGVLFFIYGLVLGSFYNVLIYRLPLEKPVHSGRSHCPNCSTTLKPLDLFPVFSYVFLGGKCRYCKKEISLRYPLVELVTGILFFVAYQVFGLSIEAFLYLSFWSMLLVVTMIDWDHMIIMDAVLGVFSIINLGIVALGLRLSWTHYIMGVLTGLLFYGAIYFVAKFFYKKEAFGSGDIFLLAAVGIVFGPKMTFFAGILAFYIALLGIVLFRVFGKKIGRREEIPFGPAICISAFIVSIYGNELLNWLLGLMGY